jgi:hypothetical protein
MQADFRLTAKAACDYTKRPEVTSAPPDATDVRKTLSAAVQVDVRALGDRIGASRRNPHTAA